MPGTSVDDADAPIQSNVFNEDVILAFDILSNMKDQYEYMNGTYLGKDMTMLPFLLDLYEVEDKITMLGYISTIDNENIASASKKQNQKAKLSEAQQAKEANKWQQT